MLYLNPPAPDELNTFWAKGGSPAVIVHIALRIVLKVADVLKHVAMIRHAQQVIHLVESYIREKVSIMLPLPMEYENHGSMLETRGAPRYGIINELPPRDDNVSVLASAPFFVSPGFPKALLKQAVGVKLAIDERQGNFFFDAIVFSEKEHRQRSKPKLGDPFFRHFLNEYRRPIFNAVFPEDSDFFVPEPHRGARHTIDRRSEFSAESLPCLEHRRSTELIQLNSSFRIPFHGFSFLLKSFFKTGKQTSTLHQICQD